ncbi:MAG TPA: 4-aminobutyrate--2-oxoglutarate transaminase [Gaiellaceae bacterium]|nr:4-aminobutyrate--2-oxoglutarate transaminase [Gaiellaceae bacterium]
MATTRTIELRTDVPGPRSEEILERHRRVVARPLSIYLPLVVESASGATLTDVDGNTFIDFTGGVGCLNVGHANPRVVAAAQEQLERFTHTDYTIVPYEVYVTLAERLVALAPFRSPAKAAFFNAGTEAVENAVKFARAFTKRPALIAFEGAFHGRTLLSMTLTSKTHPYKAGLGPFAPEVYRVPFASDYRGPSTRDALAALERAFTTQVPAEQVAAIVVEPVQGEGGFVPAPREFLRGIRRLCDEHGIVLVVDEVQTGFGRTGKLFATEWYGLEPDLMTVAKSIAGGLPLSGVIGKAEIMDAPGDSAVGGTFVGNPVAQAAALAVLDAFEEDGLLERGAEVGDRIRERMLGWQERHPRIGDVRGLGAMLAIELVRDPETKEPAPELATAIVDEALSRGLLLLKAGVYGNCIRVLVPLVVTDGQLDEALDAWEAAIDAALAVP